jgi:hypothetical protein
MMEEDPNNKFLQWNCHSKLPELQQRANQYDITLLSETWLSEEDTVYMKGFDIIRNDKRGTHWRWRCYHHQEWTEIPKNKKSL